MSSQRLEKLYVRRKKVELQLQRINAEASLKELELTTIIKEIKTIRSKKLGVANG